MTPRDEAMIGLLGIGTGITGLLGGEKTSLTGRAGVKKRARGTIQRGIMTEIETDTETRRGKGEIEIEGPIRIGITIEGDDCTPSSCRQPRIRDVSMKL